MERSKQSARLPAPNRALRYGLCGAAGLAIVAVFAISQPRQQQPAPSMAPGSGMNVDRPYLVPDANRLPDANDQMQMREQQGKKNKFDAANLERRRQISSDAAKLLQLATELKTEIDKTGKDTLSLNVIRKADEIERLAKGVKQKMNLTVGGN